MGKQREREEKGREKGVSSVRVRGKGRSIEERKRGIRVRRVGKKSEKK